METSPCKKQLSVSIEDDQLVIRIGVETLGYAVSHTDILYNDEEGGYPKVTDCRKLAHDILLELEQEDEEGTTMIHEMFDQACEKAVENGSEGLDFTHFTNDD